RIIDHCVEAAAAQGIKLTLAIADQRLDVLGSAGGGLAAVEVRDPPAAALRLLGEVRTDEAGAAENQQRSGTGFCQSRRQRSRGRSPGGELQHDAPGGHGTLILGPPARAGPAAGLPPVAGLIPVGAVWCPERFRPLKGWPWVHLRPKRWPGASYPRAATLESAAVSVSGP